MEDIDIYGKHINDIPGINTIKTLEKRQDYILKKLQTKIEDNTYYQYLITELKALEKTMNFIKWIQNNFTNDLIKEVINQYKIENKKSDEEIETEEEGNIYGIINEKLNKKNKLEIILSENNGLDYVLIESKKLKENKIMWKKTGEIKITLNKLEKILRMIKEMENNKNNGT